MYVTQTTTQPSFLMPYTDPSKDVDVSGSLSANRIIEPGLSFLWSKLGRQCCAANGLMLDMGANFGYYSLFAAKMGCRVIAWEPVPTFRDFLEVGARLNNVSHRIHIRGSVLSDVPGQTVDMQVATQGNWGTSSVGGQNLDDALRNGSYTIRVPTETVDAVLASAGGVRHGEKNGETLCLAKLDVEGHEPEVIRGAAELFAQTPPRHMIMEYSPGVGERGLTGDASREAWEKLRSYPESLTALAIAGYRVWHVHKDSHFGALSNGMNGDWASAPLPRLREVGAAALHAETLNARNHEAAISNGRAFLVPWHLHPQSLHASFSHNTDVLLTQDHAAIPADGEVGLRPSDAFGLGGGECSSTLFEVAKDARVVGEMIGRLCVPYGRAATIQQAIDEAEEAGRSTGPALRSLLDSRQARLREAKRRWTVESGTIRRRVDGASFGSRDFARLVNDSAVTSEVSPGTPSMVES